MSNTPHNPLRDAVPEEVARWLDAWSVSTNNEVGRPGFDDLRQAWVGRAPLAETLEMLGPWLEEREELQRDAEAVYRRLLEEQPLPTYEGQSSSDPVVPEWFFTSWSEVLLTRPWDEQLPDAIFSAKSYLDGQSDQADA
jgi:hypothetical protein